MITVLVAGFGPFPGTPNNPSAALVRALARCRRPALADAHIISVVIPTSYAAVSGEFSDLLGKHDPDAVLLFGLASRTKFMRVERRAVNNTTSVYPDAIGNKVAARRLFPESPAELNVRAPVAALLHAARSAGVDARPSRDAGRYICNAALFAALETARQSGRPKRVAFVHIPRPRAHTYSPKRCARPSMAALIRAGEAVLVALLADLRRG